MYGENVHEQFQMMRDKDYDANTPLLLAVEGGSSDITRHLIEYGSDVNHYNISRVHPLHTACTIGSLEIVKILLDVSAMQVCIGFPYLMITHI